MKRVRAESGTAIAVENARIRADRLDDGRRRQTGSTNAELAGGRTSLAKFRTQLALDRTTLAWIRTTLTMATFGFGTVGFFRALREESPRLETVQLHDAAIRFGFALVVLRIAVLLAIAGLVAVGSLIAT